MRNLYPHPGDDLLKETRFQQPGFCESDWLEYRFHRLLTCWQKINNWFSSHSFNNKEDEIYFFKYIKPGFIGFLNYYARRYQNLRFRPVSGSDQLSFFQRELIKCEKFYCDHTEFYNYYTEGRTEQDNEYFRKTFLDTACAFEKLYDGSNGLASPKDRLAADIITNSLYRDYLLRLLSTFNTSQPGVVTDEQIRA